MFYHGFFLSGIKTQRPALIVTLRRLAGGIERLLLLKQAAAQAIPSSIALLMAALIGQSRRNAGSQCISARRLDPIDVLRA